MPTSANVIWGARCGKPARRVLLGETRTRGHAYSVRRRRESACDRKAPHRLQSSRLVSTNLLDLWFEKKIKPTCQGEAYLTRFADDWWETSNTGAMRRGSNRTSLLDSGSLDWNWQKKRRG